MEKLRNFIRHFMAGRYGTDKLNIAILTAGVVVCLLGMFPLFIPIKLLLSTVSWALMFWAIFRCLSRNTYKRYQENRKYLRFMEQLKDRQHRYYTCPRCRQPVRVPGARARSPSPAPSARKSLSKRLKFTVIPKE